MKKYLAIAIACCALAALCMQTAAAQGADQPTIQKDSLQVTAWTNNSYKGNFDVWSWVPKFEFRVNGPIESGSQLFVEVQQPGGTAPWLTFDCETGETQKGYWWKTECGGRQVEDKSILPVGPVNFAIKLRNELAGTNTTLFTGKFKVAKTVLQQPIDRAQISKLLRTKRTDLLSQFISKAGKPFSAYLVMDGAGKVTFEFPSRNAESPSMTR